MKMEPVMGKIAIVMVRLYQLVASPYWPGNCRHRPTCSHYVQEAISKHGVRRGGWMAVGRLSRCRPFGSSGFDPVP